MDVKITSGTIFRHYCFGGLRSPATCAEPVRPHPWRSIGDTKLSRAYSGGHREVSDPCLRPSVEVLGQVIRNDRAGTGADASEDAVGELRPGSVT